MSGRSRLNLYLAVFAANVGSFALGSLYSWTSPALPKLTASDSWLPVDTAQASWIGSLIGVGSVFGPFVGGVLVDRVGRRGSMVVAVVIGLVAWAVLYVARAVWHIYLSRLVGGLGGGLIMTIVPLYIAEVAEDDVRSALGSTFNFFFSSGYLVEYIFGPPLSYWNLILVSCIASVLFFFLLPFLPESSYYYVLKEDSKNALSSLKRIRKGWSEEDVERELVIVKDSVQQSMKERGTLMELVSSRANRRGLVLSIGAMSVQQLSGINAVLFYSETIFSDAGQLSVSASDATVVVALILIITAGIAAPLTRAFGIKHMLIASASGMFIFQALTGLYFFLLQTGADLSEVRWLPILCLVGYVTSYSVGYGPLPTAVKGEVFPPNVKGVSAAVTVAYSWGMSFLVTFVFPHVHAALGLHTVFWLFSAACFLGILFSVFVMIDSRGLSLQDIQDLLSERTTSKARKTSQLEMNAVA